MLLQRRRMAQFARPPLIVSMPQLSPSMNHGSVHRWCKAHGETIESYDVLLEVKTGELLSEEYREPGQIDIMEIESHEDGAIARLLVDASDAQIPVGEPIAVLAEDEGDLDAMSQLALEDVKQLLKTPGAYRTFCWQAYKVPGSS